MSIAYIIFLIIFLFLFSRIFRPLIIMLVGLSLFRSYILKVESFDINTIEIIVIKLYKKYNISLDVIVEESYDQYTTDSVMTRCTLGIFDKGGYTVYVDMDRFKLGKIFPIYKDACILYSILYNIKTLKKYVYKDENEDVTNFIFDGFIDNYKLLFMKNIE